MDQGRLSTRQKLLEVSEGLFATKGVNATLVGDIVTGAGQRNPSALRYHFGSREGVLQAIREKYLNLIEQRRVELLDQWPGQGPTTAEDAVTLAVIPLVELLQTEPGRRYLQILGQTMYDIDPDQMKEVSRYPSLARVIDLMRAGMAHVPGSLVEDRVRGTLLLIAAALAVRARDVANKRHPSSSIIDFQNNVIAMATAILAAPIDA
ncbi:TetR family transcriptional regulator [Dietzia kunjamensis]|uniref:TetR/AcrR family transcriptional regulator n=1 Tax=Dietzia kunjamensis TaxID=322509 RepID=UPI002DBFDDF7|nr:hypothetical protein [Dietzia kunjamensis]MEB8326575.1 TetR family transcriptional regulator [Dietzia kunjamensis]